MSTLEEIKRAIREMSSGHIDGMIFEAEVVKVSDETISVKEDGTELTEVRTCADTDGDRQNLRIYPKVGSTVVCLDLSGDKRTDIIVIQYSKIEKVTIHGGEHTSVNGDLLVEQLKNLTARVDALYDAFRSWTPAAQDGGSALKTTAMAKISGKQSEDYSRVEDKTIKH